MEPKTIVPFSFRWQGTNKIIQHYDLWLIITIKSTDVVTKGTSWNELILKILLEVLDSDNAEIKTLHSMCPKNKSNTICKHDILVPLLTTLILTQMGIPSVNFTLYFIFRLCSCLVQSNSLQSRVECPRQRSLYSIPESGSLKVNSICYK